METRLYSRYDSMITRCYNPNWSGYRYWGGRGITVCEEWRERRQAFYEWANVSGFKPELQLDRIDNDGPYSPDNCRWVTDAEQRRNRSNTTTDWEKGQRICYRCKKEKPLKDFYRNKTKPLGRMRICIDCSKKKHKETYSPEKRKKWYLRRKAEAK